MNMSKSPTRVSDKTTEITDNNDTRTPIVEGFIEHETKIAVREDCDINFPEIKVAL